MLLDSKFLFLNVPFYSQVFFLREKKDEKRRKSQVVGWKQHKLERNRKGNAVSNSGSLLRNDERVFGVEVR